jgi:hypothetical protein
MPNKTPFMPPLNSWWRLVNEVKFPFVGITYGNDEFLDNMFGTLRPHEWLNANPGMRDDNGSIWVPLYHQYLADKRPPELVIPAGTVFSFNRYHASNSGAVNMTLQFIASPDPFLTPKKRGGKGKGAMRFYVNLDQFNSLGEMQQVDPE